MRKVLLTGVLLGVLFTFSACARNKDVVSDDSSKLLDKPEVTQAATKEKKAEAQIQITIRRTGTRKFSLGKMNCFSEYCRG